MRLSSSTSRMRLAVELREVQLLRLEEMLQ